MAEATVGTVIEGEIAPVQQQTTDTPRDFESEAREMGWVPESEFRGAKDKWKPAEQFVTEGENFIPFLKANERKLRRELKEKEQEVSTRVAKMERMLQSNFEREAANYKARIAELEARQIEAVKAGDTDEFKRLKTEINKTPIPEEPDVGGTVTPDNLEEKFAAENPWYGQDEDLTSYAQGYSQRIAQKHLDDHGVEMPMADNLKKVLAKVRATFPAKFRDAAPGNGHAAVDGGGNFGAPPAKSDPFARLPAEARAQAKADMAKYPTFFKTPADWIAKYEGKN
jgi:hypothetical protein